MMKKKALLILPEIFLLLIAIYWIADNYIYSSFVNVYAILFSAVLIYQLIFKKRLIGIVLSLLSILLSLFFILAVISEFNEFTTITSNAITLLLVGLSIGAIGVIVSMMMLTKYNKKLV